MSVTSEMKQRAVAKRLPRAKREALLEAATGLFLEAGYQGASLNELVSRVGGSKGTIYSHFTDKEGLFAAIIDAMLAHLHDSLTGLDIARLSLDDALASIARKTLDVLTSERGLALQRLVFWEAQRMPEIGRLYYAHGPEIGFAELARYLQDFGRSGGRLRLPSERAAELFWGLLLHKPLLMSYCRVGDALQPHEIDRLVDTAIADFKSVVIEQ